MTTAKERMLAAATLEEIITAKTLCDIEVAAAKDSIAELKAEIKTKQSQIKEFQKSNYEVESLVKECLFNLQIT